MLMRFRMINTSTLEYLNVAFTVDWIGMQVILCVRLPLTRHVGIVYEMLD